MEKSRLKGRLYFYPRPPRGGRPTRTTRCPSPSNFYPRPPRGGRLLFVVVVVVGCVFLSTPSARRATDSEGKKELTLDISIHALREEGDGAGLRKSSDTPYFYPRPPRGGRPESLIIINSKFEFLSTPSARRATKCCRCCCQYTSISIHALREEGDRWRWSAPPQRYNFYPRPPRGGRRVGHNRESVRRAFLSTPSARRATDRTFAFSIRYNISIHALREEGDPRRHYEAGH